MADQTGIPQTSTSPPSPAASGYSTVSSDTFPMVFPDGSRAMVPSARVNDAFTKGQGKLAQPMRMRDGSTQLVPFDQVHNYMSQGATFMPSSAAGMVPKPSVPRPNIYNRQGQLATRGFQMTTEPTLGDYLATAINLGSDAAPGAESATMPVGTEEVGGYRQATAPGATPDERMAGVARMVGATGEALSPMMGPELFGGLGQVAKLGAGLGLGMAGGKVAPAVVQHYGGGPGAQQLAGELGQWIPSAIGMLAGAASPEDYATTRGNTVDALTRDILAKGGVDEPLARETAQGMMRRYEQTQDPRWLDASNATAVGQLPNAPAPSLGKAITTKALQGAAALQGTARGALGAGLGQEQREPVAPPFAGLGQPSPVADFLGRSMTRMAQEAQGQGVLDDMTDQGISPRDVSRQFWDQTYFNLPAQVQAKFRNYLTRETGGLKPGDTIGFTADQQPIVAQDWAHLADTILDLPSDPEHLEGTTRGLVALMKVANDRFGTTGGTAGPELYTRADESQQPTGQPDPREQQREAADARSPQEAAGGNAQGLSYAFTRKGGGDAQGVRSILGVPVRESWSLNPETAAILQSRGFQTPDFHELDYSHSAAAQTFRDQIAKTKIGNRYAASVHVYSPEEYSQMRLFLTGDGKAGLAIKPDGDIVSGFSHGDGPKGAMHTMLEVAKQAGGTKLDAFDTILPKIYGDHGFTAVARLPWNDDYIPEGWNKNTYAEFNGGEPDVVFMARDPNAVPYQAGDGARVGSYDDAIRLQQQVIDKFGRRDTGLRSAAQPGLHPTRTVRPWDTWQSAQDMNTALDEGGPNRAAAIHLDDNATHVLEGLGLGQWRGLNIPGSEGRRIAGLLRDQADRIEQNGGYGNAADSSRNLADQIDRAVSLNYDPNAGHAGVPLIHEPMSLSHEAVVHAGQRAFAGDEGDIRNFTDADATVNHPTVPKALQGLLQMGYGNPVYDSSGQLTHFSIHPAVAAAELQAHILDGNAAKLGLTPEEAIDFIKHSRDVLAQFHGPEKMENVPRLAQGYIDALDQFIGAQHGQATTAAAAPEVLQPPEAAQQARTGPEYGANAPLGENAEGASRQGNRGVGPEQEQVGPSLAARAPRAAPSLPGDEHVVSTRNPTGKPEDNAFDPHVDRGQTIGMKEIVDAGIQDKVLKAIREYPGMKGLLKGVTDPQEAMRRFINFTADNLVALHKLIPENIRTLSKQWYTSANGLAKELANTHAEHGITPQQAAGVIAVNSPQTDWNINVSRARRIMDIWLNQQDTPYTEKMAKKAPQIKTASLQDTLKAIKGKGLSELTDPYEQAMWVRLYDEAENPTSYEIWRPDGTVLDVARKQPTPAQERAGQLGDPAKLAWANLDHIAKSISILEDGSLNNISDNLGDKHKVRNFYNNIINPDGLHGHVTVDTHAVAAGLWRPLAGEDVEPSHNFGTGKKPVKDKQGNVIEPSIPSAGSNINEGVWGTYGLYADAYRLAAKKLRVLPRELQSMTWEGIRSLFPDTFKANQANKAIIDNIWRQVDRGKLTPQQARQAVIDAVARIKGTDRTGVFTRPDWLSDTGLHEAQGAAVNPQDVSGAGVYGGSPRSPGSRAGGRNPRGSSGQVAAAPSPVPTPLRRVMRK